MHLPWRNYLSWSPLSILGIALVILLSSQVLAVNLLLSQPWTGLNLEPDPASGFVKVVSVDKGSPAAGEIQPDTILTHIANESQSIKLSDKLFLYPFHHSNTSEYHRYQQIQTSIQNLIINNKTILLVDSEGLVKEINPRAERSINRIPKDFWVLSALFALIPFLGLIVMLYSPDKVIARLLMLACFGGYGFYYVGLINYANEFFFDKAVLEALYLIELIGLNIYMLLMMLVGFLYPFKVFNNYLILFIVFAFLFYSVNFIFEFLDIKYFYLPILGVLLILTGFLSLKRQFDYSKNKPLYRLALIIMVLSMIIPYVIVLIGYIIPIALNKSPLIKQEFIQVIGIIALFGFSISIVRFNLFQFQYWWFKSWFWLVASLLLILIDVILINFLQTSSIYVLGLSVFIVGFIYFPLRQWALARFSPLDTLTIQDFLAKFSQELIQAGSSAQELEEVWKKILKARFNPQDFSNRPETITHPQLTENGLSLQIPSLQNTGSYYLTGKQLAARLFNKADMAASSSLLEVVKITQAATELRERSMLAERDYWLQEVNATVGQDLQKLLNESNNETERMSSLDVLETLRQTIYLSTKENSLSFEENLKSWRKEIEERLSNSPTALTWQVTDILRDCYLSALQIIELSQFLREAITNALKHAQPKNLLIRFDKVNERFYLKVEHDGSFSAPKDWHAGNGLKNLRTRIAVLQGTLEFFVDSDRAYLCLDAQFPLLAKLPHG